MLRISFTFGLFVISLVDNAHAYIDPGIGAIFLQGFVAVVAGISLFFFRVRKFILKIMGIKDKDDKEDNDDDKR